MRGAVLSSVIAIALLEGAARLLPLGLPDLADLHAAWAVGSQPVFVRGEGDSMTTAPELVRLGNSPISFPARKASGTVRVFCVGDSTTVGWPVNPAGAYPRWLESILSDARPDLRFEVIDAGFHGFDSTRVLSVVRELAAYSPDVVVLHAGYDDYHLHPLRSTRLFALDSWLSLHVRVYDLARWLHGRRAGVYALQPPARRLPPAENDGIANGFLENVRSFEEAARAAGVAAILTDMPYARSREPRYPGWDSLEAMRAGQRALAAREGWTLAPLAAVENDRRFVDHVHCDAEGYRLIALDVARALQRSGRFPGRWRWERVRPAAELTRALGLEEPEFTAHVHVRLAGYFLSKNERERCDAELASALRVAPNPRLVPEEVESSGNAALSESLARARQSIGYAQRSP